MTEYSQLSLKKQPYKMDNFVKQTPRVGPCLSSFILLIHLTLYKMDIYHFWFHIGVHLSES